MTLKRFFDCSLSFDCSLAFVSFYEEPYKSKTAIKEGHEVDEQIQDKLDVGLER